MRRTAQRGPRTRRLRSRRLVPEMWPEEFEWPEYEIEDWIISQPDGNNE